MTDPRTAPEKSGLLLLDKKPGLTSFESLKALKKALGTSRVGHTGTLDKFASGLLLVLVGRALKLAPWFTRCPKEYEGTVRFGAETDTLDPEGAIVAQGPLPSREALEEALSLFRGDILQAPPAYSAIHVEGRRASELARAGEAPEMKKRPVSVYSLELLLWEPPLAGIRVSCSSGTYIRSLARDIALAVGSRAHLASLRRKRVAGFSVEDASGSPGAALLPIDGGVVGRLGLPRFEAGPDALDKMIRGRPLGPLLAGQMPLYPAGEEPSPGEDFAAAVFSGGIFAGIVEKQDGRWRYGYVYAHP
ncbi:MAG: tRNA pseudouridine(55) synthase TruB [Treponema sp.]|jgi:tRNA pseudouridine55 synthase|nr:tRNA pseudouridine(55) synthase TruB [Treponema sp.]